MRASLTQTPVWAQPTVGEQLSLLALVRDRVERLEDEAAVVADDVKPWCPICTSEDTVWFGPHEMDDGSDRWGCGLCGGEFLVVIR